MERKNNLLLGLITTFVKMSLGFLSYPLYLQYLDALELSLFFLFISTSSIIDLLDFGFANSITRYFAYSSLEKQQLNPPESTKHNLTNSIYAPELLFYFSKIYYRYLCLLAFFVLVIGFSIYLYFFLKLHHGSYWRYELIWVMYASATLIGVYYMYQSPLLVGCGHIDKVNKLSLAARLSGLATQAIMLVCGLNLVSIAIGMIVTTIVERYLLIQAVKSLAILSGRKIIKSEFWQMFKNIWRINYKLGLLTLSGIFITKINTFTAGFVIRDVTLLSEYLFTFQMVTVLLFLAHIPVSNNFGDIAAYYVKDHTKAINLFLKSNKQSLWLMLLCCLGMLVLGNPLLEMLHFKHHLLTLHYTIIIVLIYLLEKQLINHAAMISIRNEVPMLKSYLITCCVTLILLFLLAYILKLGIWALILPQLLAQSCFNYWYWVRYNLKEDHISKKYYLQDLFRYSS